MGLTYLIVGLGNPGKKYRNTRHNIGFMVVDALAAKFQKSFRVFDDTFWKTTIEHNAGTAILMKPRTYMNLSGIAVALACGYFGVSVSNLLIICDDINLKFGTIRIRAKGSDGGQKGLRSIIAHLGTQEFPRLRIGIGDHFEDAVEHVLSPFNAGESKELPLIISTAAEAVESFMEHGIELTMSRFNKNYLENG